MNLISPQCHTNSHVFHTVSRLLPLTLTSPPPCKPFICPAFHPKCDPLPWGDIFGELRSVQCGRYRLSAPVTLYFCQQYIANESNIAMHFSHFVLCCVFFGISRSFATHPLSTFLPLCRCEEGLVRPCFVVGEEEDMAAENPLDIGQVRHPSRRQAAFHAAAQAATPPAAQHEAHEGQGQLLGPCLQGCVRHLQNFQ